MDRIRRERMGDDKGIDMNFKLDIFGNKKFYLRTRRVS